MKKISAIIIALIMIFTTFSQSVYSLSWDGSSAGGSTNAVNGSSTGYVIRSTEDSECVVGYRFSVVNSSGSLKVNKVIDVFRNTTYGNNAYSGSAKFSAKYNKKQLIANKNAKLSTTDNTVSCYLEKNMSFASSLPNPASVGNWQKYEQNLNKVLNKIGAGSVSGLVYGDKVIIEPIFDVCLAGEYQALTVSEIAYCGRSVLGGSSNGGTLSYDSSKWGFIANYTNRIWPNKLFTPDGLGLWTAASTIGSSSRGTFDVLLTRGYGVGIAYTETQNITYTIKFNGNGATSGSTASMTMVKNVAKNLTANGFKKTNNNFTGWNTKADGTGTKYTDKQSVNNLTSTQGATVNLYAQWSAYVLTIAFDCTDTKVTVTDTSKGFTFGDSKRICTTTGTNKTISGTANVYYQTIKYNNAIGGNGLHDFVTFGLSAPTGYKFMGWKSRANGKVFDESTTTYKASDFTDSIKTGNATVWLTSQISPIAYLVKFNGNGSTSGTMSNQSHKYDTAQNLTANAFKREFTVIYNYNGSGAVNTNAKATATFNGWAKTSTGSVVYTNQQSVKNLTTVSADVINLYAKWTDSSVTLPNPTRNGYIFDGWYSSATGGTKIGNGGTSYTPTSNITLYAHWTERAKYVISYNANGGINAPGNQTKNEDTSITLSSAKPTRTGYTFSIWNTKADGTGTSYNPGTVYSSNANLTLYAIWTPITYTVKFNGNGSTSGAMSNQSFKYDVAQNLTANAFKREFTVTYNYNGNGTANTNITATATFNGWAKTTSGSVVYTNQQSVKNLTTTNGATVNIYAKWTDGSVTLPKPTRTGYTFDGWYSSATIGTKIGDGGTKYTPAKNITLYAHWMPITYTVSYDANGGTNAPSSQTKTYGVNLTLSSKTPTKTDCVFTSWNTKADGTGTKYNPSSVYSANADLTLYAIWENVQTLLLEPITPNAPYRESTDVITSFYIKNISNNDCIPNDNISVRFTVYKGSTIIKTETLTKVVVPSNDKNLIYFKWNVPNNIGMNEIKITGEIIDGGNAYGLVTRIYDTCKYEISETPDTQYEYSAPQGFSVPTKPENHSTKATWSEWKYQNGAFYKESYGISISADNPDITPDENANATFTSGIWTTKSGYGFNIAIDNSVISISGYTMPDDKAYTKPQYTKVLFPEFGYSETLNNYRTLELSENSWMFKQNGGYGRVHYTPLWYPDGNYSVFVIKEDCWTPIGMITKKAGSNGLIISGSAYDDWYE